MSVANVMERYKEHGDLPRALSEAGYPHLASAITGDSKAEYAPKSFRENAPADRVQPEDDGDNEETSFERHLKERDRARESNKEQDTQNSMRELEESSRRGR